MTDQTRRPVLYVIACGGRPAGDLPDFVTRLQADGWEVCVIATPSALKFMDVARLAGLTGHVVRFDYKQPDEPDVLPPPDAMVVAPATFNTICKWAYGSSDTLALGLLNESIGLGLPVIAVPTPNTALAKHPAFIESVARLRSWGVTVLFDPEVYPLPTPNMGPSAASLFPWEALAAEVVAIRERGCSSVRSRWQRTLSSARQARPFIWQDLLKPCGTLPRVSEAKGCLRWSTLKRSPGHGRS